ncbi:MAG: hypothetical protein HRT82_15865 [Henriciella sp.]|nr:hypothetical protein [Henriciella sp.]
MTVAIQTAEAIEAGQRFMKELQDIIDATEDASGDSNDAMGHNGKRSAANDGINITRNILRRLGAVPVEAKPPEQPPEPTVAKAVLDQLETVQEALAEAAKAKLDDRPADPLEVSEEPPEAIADLFQSDRPYADQAQALWTKYNELTQKIMMNLATDAERAKHAKLQGELDWIKHHVFEAV